MSRPLTSLEQTQESRGSWLRGEREKARAVRGNDAADMEHWIRVTRSWMAKFRKRQGSDIDRAYARVNKLFLVALQQHMDGNPRLMEDLLSYAQQVLEKRPPRD